MARDRQVRSPGSKPGRTYRGRYLDQIAFPLGGLGAGMFCLEGFGSPEHFSILHRPHLYNSPGFFSAVHVRNRGTAKVLEGQIPRTKIFGSKGGPGRVYGFPRFRDCRFSSRFPFCEIDLEDETFPLKARLTAWSPFVPGDSFSSSLPVAAFEYELSNTGDEPVDAVFSFHFFKNTLPGNTSVTASPLGFTVQSNNAYRNTGPSRDNKKAWFSVEAPNSNPLVNCRWFRGILRDTHMMLWNSIASGETVSCGADYEDHSSPGASLTVELCLGPGEETTIPLLFSWYVPESIFHFDNARAWKKPNRGFGDGRKYAPWYASQFDSIEEVASFWSGNYSDMRTTTQTFSDTFYGSTLPDEIVEAVAANLSILKSPTILRQHDGRYWAWEGTGEREGSCHGSCTHVWNYCQALAHLFPDLERMQRATEYDEMLYEDGFQSFRVELPIQKGPRFVSELDTTPHAAADGQLGSIIRLYRDWRISGDARWIEQFWERMLLSLEYCIRTWDPDEKGALIEPHHNTYDISFWGPDGMMTGIYAQALNAVVAIGRSLNRDVDRYSALLDRAKSMMEEELFNGEYFRQHVTWKGLRAESPVNDTTKNGQRFYSEEAAELLEEEGPKYQYGNGCISDNIIGEWLGFVAGLPAVVDGEKIASALLSVYRYNHRKTLLDHPNAHRAKFALGDEGGLLLCTWPHGDSQTMPFFYSAEVWTGVEYQVASHLFSCGYVEEGLEVVRTCRARYAGDVRNPFGEYEAGNFYGRALSSYGLLQGITGIRYDAIEQVLYISPAIKGDFTSFISTGTGFGNAGIRNGQPFLEVTHGDIAVKGIEAAGALAR